MKSILEEGEKSMNMITPDEAIIANAWKAQKYKIAAYRSAAHYTDLLGYTPIDSRLRLTLEEEQQAEGKLKFLANEVIGWAQGMHRRNELIDAEVT